MAHAQGKIVQCIGAVVDVEFARNEMPSVYDALKMEGSALTLEVQQQLGDGVVRTIALGSLAGLRRGKAVSETTLTLPTNREGWIAVARGTEENNREQNAERSRAAMLDGTEG